MTDSHFGHLVPLGFLRLWKVFATCSFRTSRVGVKIPSLSKADLKIEEREELLRTEEGQKLLRTFEPDNDDSESSDTEEKEDMTLKKKLLRKMSTRLVFFEKTLSLEKKGSSRVWKSTLQLTDHKRALIYLHAINDSKVCYRISSRYAGLPKVKMSVTARELGIGKKRKIEVETTAAHKCFRKKMGFNDQSDAKRMHIGLSAKKYTRWPQHILAKTLEDAIINSYNNYLLDPECTQESFPVYLINLVQEFLDSGENMRSYKATDIKFKRSHTTPPKKPHPGKDNTLKIGENCPAKSSYAAIREVPIKLRTKQCAFCGRRHAKFKCRGCHMHLCVQRPKNSRGITYPANGPGCFFRFHGVSSFPR